MTSNYPGSDEPTTEQAFFPPIGGVAVDEPPIDGPAEPIDEDFAPRPRFRLSALSILLIAILVAGLGFLGGVSVGQDHASSSGGTGGRATGNARGGEGFGNFGGGTTTTTVPVVIGTIASVKGQTVVVKNLGATSVTVHMTATTTVTKTATAPALAAGQSVSVYGTTGSDSSVTATNITVR
jgi:hypothetical protein